MKPAPVTPANIVFSDDGQPPWAADFGDVYHPRAGALVQASQVFLAGNGLPARWAGRERFVVLETGFGLGNNFLVTWQAWRQDTARCRQLDFVSVERHPPSPADLARAHQGHPLPALAQALQAAWPPLAAGLHLLSFDEGRVRLLLALGDVQALLPALRLQADALYLDGFAPDRNPAMWTPRVLAALGRRAAPGATAATWSVAAPLRHGLQAAGFTPRRVPGRHGQREITVAGFAPRHPLPAPGASPRTALVVGAGLAGAAVASALARRGLAVTVLDRQAQPATEASGNPAGLFHGTVHPDDGPYARLFRAAALHAQRVYSAAVAAGVRGQVQGLLRLDTRAGGLAAMQALQARAGVPPAYVQALDAAQAAQLAGVAGVALAHPAWYYPGGGWMDPADWVRHALRTPGLHFQGGQAVHRLTRQGDPGGPGGAWQAWDAQGRLLAQADVLVLANAGDAARLLAPLGGPAWPLRHTRGQVTAFDSAGDNPPLLRPLAGDGYALPQPARPGEAVAGLLCGATREPGDPGDDPAPRDDDHRHNLQRCQRLTGLPVPSDPQAWRGRVAWRLHSDDRLPLAGALPALRMPPGQRMDQARWLPRESGLFVLTALGARGLTLAPLLGELVAAMAAGAPWPLEQDLVDAVDPGRWLVRAARAADARPAPMPAPVPAPTRSGA